ncbi:DPYD [Mytilus coruscus]|uniref:DPYD n=1 Tax=Mytilus coruscus TaxID=42192 RepID=A0A6J8CR38_MYTCO|nr:DPYD [Mytilus coruscus]
MESVSSSKHDGVEKSFLIVVVSIEEATYQDHDEPFLKNGLATHKYPVGGLVCRHATGVLEMEHKENDGISVNVATRNMTKKRTDELPVKFKDEVTTEKLIQLQKEDSYIKFIIDYKNIDVKLGLQAYQGIEIKSIYLNQWDSLQFKTCILCRKLENNFRDEIMWQIVLPALIRAATLQYY